MAKKNKKEIKKRRSKAAQKHQIGRKEKTALLRGQSHVQVQYRPGIAEMEAPPGFRAISMSQAMLEYGKPLNELVVPTAIDDMDNLEMIMKITMLLWNHALSVEKGEEEEREKVSVTGILEKAFGLKKDEAESLRKRMVERRSFLFPEDKQPKDRLTPFMFIRKEKVVRIEPFAYNRLIPTKTNIPYSSEDEGLIDKIIKLDQLILEETDYEDYENLFTEVKDGAERLFGKWLADKGFPEEFLSLTECLSIYLDFIYGYAHDDIITLKSISPGYLMEFFEDFLLRKMYVEPQEYVDWPPSIKLFYQFLKDKRYIEDPASIIYAVNRLETRFLEVLTRQFG
jgi:hypothetical protein